MKLLSLIIFILATSLVQAQQERKFANSLQLTNGEQTVEFLLKDTLQYSFFKTGKVKSLKDKADTYSLIMKVSKQGKHQSLISNTFQWPDTIVQYIYIIRPDSMEILKQSVYDKKISSKLYSIKLKD